MARRLSLRLILADGTLVAQVDDGLESLNKIQLFVPPDAVPGPYGLHLMVYDAESFEPIPAPDGQQIVQVTTVQVGDEPSYGAIARTVARYLGYEGVVRRKRRHRLAGYSRDHAINPADQGSDIALNSSSPIVGMPNSCAPAGLPAASPTTT